MLLSGYKIVEKLDDNFVFYIFGVGILEQWYCFSKVKSFVCFT